MLQHTIQRGTLIESPFIDQEFCLCSRLVRTVSGTQANKLIRNGGEGTACEIADSAPRGFEPKNTSYAAMKAARLLSLAAQDHVSTSGVDYGVGLGTPCAEYRAGVRLRSNNALLAHCETRTLMS